MKLSGILLAVASVAFWLAWKLMPGVGVTDTATIFALVGAHRGQVYVSVVVQLVSAAACAVAVAGLLGAERARGSRALRAGAILLLLGALGSAADAIFHVVAFEMTAPGVNREAMAPVMQKLQGPDLVLLLPLVAAWFAGHAFVVVAARKDGPVARAAFWLLLASPAALVLGPLAFLAATSGSLALAGAALARAARA